jgi:hypothetical protein
MSWAEFFLAFTHIPIVCGILCIYFIFFSRWGAVHLIYIIAFGMILNVALKGTFQYPLPIELHHKGYALPSGHMQMATILYGWIAMHTRSYFVRIGIGILLIGIGFGLGYCHYHDIYDVLAGVCTGLICLGIYQHTLGYRARSVWLGWLGMGSLLMAYDFHIYHHVPRHAICAYLVLFGLSVILWIIYRWKQKKQ